MPRTTPIEKIEAELAALEEQIKKLRAKWRLAKGRILKVKYADILSGEELSLEQIMKVDWLEVGNGAIPVAKKVYDRCSKALVFETFQGRLAGLYHSGQWQETRQVAFSLKLDQNKPLEEQMGAKIILPLVTPFEGWRRFAIFRYDLSTSGSWTLMVHEEDGRAQVVEYRAWTYRQEVEKTFPDIDKALEYCYENHPYELKKVKRRHDEDDYDTGDSGW